MTDQKFRTDVPVPKHLEMSVDEDKFVIGCDDAQWAFDVAEARALRDYLNAVLPDDYDARKHEAMYP